MKLLRSQKSKSAVNYPLCLAFCTRNYPPVCRKHLPEKCRRDVGGSHLLQQTQRVCPCVCFRLIDSFLQQCTVNICILTVIIELMRAWELERKLNRSQDQKKTVMEWIDLLDGGKMGCMCLSLYMALGIALHTWIQHCCPLGPAPLAHRKPHRRPQPQPMLCLHHEPMLSALECAINPIPPSFLSSLLLCDNSLFESIFFSVFLTSSRSIKWEEAGFFPLFLEFMSLIAESSISSKASEEHGEQWSFSPCCSSRMWPKEKLQSAYRQQLSRKAAIFPWATIWCRLFILLIYLAGTG